MAVHQRDTQTVHRRGASRISAIGAQREFCRAWPNQETVVMQGSHFMQEEAPDEVGEATARFVAKVLAGQIA